MKKRILFLILAMLFVVTVFTACNQEEERQEMIISMDRYMYADNLGFAGRIMVDGEEIIVTDWMGRFDEIALRITFPNEERLPGQPEFDPFYTELVFVHSEAEAEGFPDSTVVAWPQEGMAEGVINGLRWAALRDEIDMEAELGELYPLTVANLVDDWKAVARLISLLGAPNPMNTIRSGAERDGAEAFLLEIERRQLVGNREAVDKIIIRDMELRLDLSESLDLLRAAGSVEAFFAITDRMLAEGLSVEDALAALQE